MTATTLFHLHEEKKHSVRYDCDEDEKKPVTRAIYISKSVLTAKPYPKSLKVTITDD